MNLRALLLLPLLPAAVYAAAVPLEFDGFSVQGGVTMVMLQKTATDPREYKWVPVGGKWGGYIIESCTVSSSSPKIVLRSVVSGQKQTLGIRDVSVGVSAPIVVQPASVPDALRAQAVAQAQAQATAQAQAQGPDVFTTAAPMPPPAPPASQ